MSAAEESPDFSGAANFQTTAVRPRAYGDALLALGRQRPEIVVLTADLTAPTETDLFRDEFPDRFFNMGIAEANMIGVASGMARAGDVPWVHSFSVFVTRRCYDQIAMQVAYPRANLKIVGYLPGLTTQLGVSHQAIDDVALMRALPNMTIIEPGDAAEIGPAVRAAAAHDGPVYLRLRRIDTHLPEVSPDFTLGRAKLLRDGPDGAILAYGLMLPLAMEAAEREAKAGRQVAVADIPTLKPLDVEFIRDLARRTGPIVTAENHSIIGGLGSAVAEVLAEAALAPGFARVGVRDEFAEGGSTPYLWKKYGLTVEAIIEALDRARRK